MALPQSVPTFPWFYEISLGSRLRAVRAAADVSREVAAERCGEGFSATTWGRWENEHGKEPTTAQVRTIARVFELDFRWLGSGTMDIRAYPLSGIAQERLPLDEGWEANGEQLAWPTRKSLTVTQRGNAAADSRPTRSAATAPSTCRSLDGSEIAA